MRFECNMCMSAAIVVHLSSFFRPGGYSTAGKGLCGCVEGLL
jgi:hypothetical protein